MILKGFKGREGGVELWTSGHLVTEGIFLKGEKKRGCITKNRIRCPGGNDEL